MSACLLPPAPAQFVQQGGKLVGTSAGAQGSSVAVSSDGNTAIVGGPGDSGGQGAAWVWTRTGGVWTQQAKLVGTGSSPVPFSPEQGYSVGISGDGNTAIVGGYLDNDRLGAAWVFTRTNGAWSQQGGKLSAADATLNMSQGALQGTSVALSADGNTAIVGGMGDTGFLGAAWIWTRAGGVWTQQGGKLVGTGAAGVGPTLTNIGQGTSVAISGDGNTAIVGGPGDAGSLGAAWVWTRTGGVWTQQGGKLVGTGAAGAGPGFESVDQGDSVALSADGNTAIVGASGDNSGQGAVWVFTRTGGVWTQQGGKLVGTGVSGSINPGQGTSVGVSADGNTAIAGGPGDGVGYGAAWVWTRTGGLWTQLGKLSGTGATGSTSSQGSSVAISGDATTALVGAPKDASSTGATWVFVNGGPSTSGAPTILTDGTGVINGGSYAPGNVVSGSWVSIKGSGFTNQTVDWSSFDFSKGTLPTSLNGVQVLFNGQPGAMWYLIAGTPQQINVQAPANLSGNVSVQVVNGTLMSNTVTTTAVSVAPAIFAYTLDNGATFYPSAIFLDGTRLGDPANFPGARKAKTGDVVVIYANSLAPSAAGVVKVSGVTDPVTIKIGSVVVSAIASELVAPGEFQIAFNVPNVGSSGNYPFTIIIDGTSSQPGISFPYTN